MIAVPLNKATERIDLMMSRGAIEPTIADEGIVLGGSSIMLVEDEMIVALAVNDSLTDLGFSVVGPFSWVSNACRALQDGQVDAAILDVNLDGEMVYSLADLFNRSKYSIRVRDWI